MTSMLVFRVLRIAALLVLTSIASSIPAQTPLPQPDIDLAAAGAVSALARQPDGGTIVGGYFLSLGGAPRTSIARLRPDGTLDPDWAPQLFGNVEALATDAGGNVYASGSFGLVRLAGGGTGAVDPTWQPAIEGSVEHMALDGNGYLYVAGAQLTQVGGLPAAGIARIPVAGNGAVDPGWALSAPADGRIYAIAADATALYVGGSFDNIGGQQRRNLAKLSTTGSVDATWQPGTDDLVYTLATGPADTLFVAGNFRTAGGQALQGLARLSRAGAGSADASWRPLNDGSVSELAFDGAGALYAAGWFRPSGAGETYRAIGKIATATGSVDPAWHPEPNAQVLSLAAGGGTGFAVGGQFDRIDQSSRLGIAAYDTSGVLLPATNAERAPHVWAVARQADGGIIVGGEFHRAGAFERRYLMRVTPAGTVDPTWDPSADNQVLALKIGTDGSIFAGGLFTGMSGQPRNYLAKLSGSGVLDNVWNPQPNFVVRAIDIDAAGNVYLGGPFTRIGGLDRGGVAKVSAAGNVDPVWSPTITGETNTLALDGKGALYVGGLFTQVNGLDRNNLAKLPTTGTGAPFANWQPSVDSRVLAVAADGAGLLYVGGWFKTIDAQERESLARINPDGTLDLDWNPLPPTGSTVRNIIRTVALDDAGMLYAGGAIYSQSPVRWIVRASPSGDLDASWNPDADMEVSAFATTPGGSLIAGGGFTTIGGQPRDGLAALVTVDAIFADGFEPQL